jgi:TM2 domain-containing membrane protein YozV
MIHLAILAALYFLPTIVAAHRGHGVAGVLLLNFLVGWTGIGWIVLMVWALMSAPRYLVLPPGYCPPNHGRNWPGSF